MRPVAASTRTSRAPPSSLTHRPVRDAASAARRERQVDGRTRRRPSTGRAAPAAAPSGSSAHGAPATTATSATAPGSCACATTRRSATSTSATPPASRRRRGGAGASGSAVVGGDDAAAAVSRGRRRGRGRRGPGRGAGVRRADRVVAAGPHGDRSRPRDQRDERRGARDDGGAQAAPPGRRVVQRRLGRGDQGAAVRVARGGLLGQPAGEHGVERRRQVGRQRRDGRRPLVEVREDRRDVGLAHERRRTGEAGEEHARQGVLVGAPVERVAADLLGRDVVDRADERALARQAGRRRGVPREPEVGQVRALATVDPADEDVAGRHVAVHEPGGVGGVERVGDAGQHRERPLRRQRPLVAQQRAQVDAVDVRHREVEQPAVLAGGHDPHDVRVLEPPRQGRLAEEPLAEAPVGRQRRVEHLQRDQPAGAVPRPVDHPRRAVAEHRLDREATDRRARRESRLHRTPRAYSDGVVPVGRRDVSRRSPRATARRRGRRCPAGRERRTSRAARHGRSPSRRSRGRPPDGVAVRRGRRSRRPGRRDRNDPNARTDPSGQQEAARRHPLPSPAPPSPRRLEARPRSPTGAAAPVRAERRGGRRRSRRTPRLPRHGEAPRRGSCEAPLPGC